MKVGIVGNCLSIVVLSSKEMRNTFNHLLIALACCDNTFLVLSTLDYSLARGGWKPDKNVAEGRHSSFNNKIKSVHPAPTGAFKV